VQLSGFELIFLGFQILFDSDLHKERCYLLSGQNEGRSEEVAVLVEEWDDVLVLLIWSE